jgi:hypothetical protein
MPFFFIFAVWFLCLVAGACILFVRDMRRYGLYIFVVSTAATFFSFALSTGVLYVCSRYAVSTGAGRVPLIILYLFSIAVGLLLGGVGGARVLRRILNVLAH